MSSICAGIVTYNPKQETLINDIDAVIEQVEHIIICDNGSNNISAINQVLEKYYADKITLICLNDNKGIAAALNFIFAKAKELGYLWVLTLDQDSVVPINLIEEYEKYIGIEKIAVIAPDIVYKDNEEYCSSSVNTYDYIEWAITSASLTSVEAWVTIEGFNEALFIDMVDYEFCWRLRQAGYKIIRVHTVRLLHELGKLQCRKILGRVIYVTNHSPFRYYYMSRNAFWVRQITGEGNPKKEVLKLTLKILAFEEQKKEKLRNIYKGAKESNKYLEEERRLK